MKSTGKRMPIRKTKANMKPATLGKVKAAQPAGFPATASSAYRTLRPPQNLKGGSNALKPTPVRRKSKKK